MEVEQEDSYFNGSDDEDDLPGPQPLPPLPTAPPSSYSAAGQGTAPSSLPSSDATRNPRKREATSSDDDRPSSSPSSAAAADSTTPISATSAPASDRGKRLRLEKTKSQVELSAGESGMSRSQTWPPGAGASPLVDYGGDDSDEEPFMTTTTSTKEDEPLEGGFVREGDEPMRELKMEADGPPIPPKRRKDDDDDDGELGLLSKGASKKVHLSPSSSASKSKLAAAPAGPKLGTFSFGGVGSKTVGNGPVGGAIKISLGIKSSLSKLAGGGKAEDKKGDQTGEEK